MRDPQAKCHVQAPTTKVGQPLIIGSLILEQSLKETTMAPPWKRTHRSNTGAKEKSVDAYKKGR